jgi:hypothetical protein
MEIDTNFAVRIFASGIRIFPLLAVIASASMWQRGTFIGAYLKAMHSISRKFNLRIHHAACLDDNSPLLQ